MGNLLKQYKGDLSNYDCLKEELENLLEEFKNINRIKVTEQFSEDILKEIKSIRLSIMAITD